MHYALSLGWALFLAGSVLAADSLPWLRVPPGFEVTEFAGSDLANDIFSLTLDARGRVVVAGRGYIRILIDDNHDGRADRALEFATAPKDGAMGLCWDGDALFVVGDGGLRRYRDADGDGRADGPSELLRALRTGGEHHAHDVKRGPDGWLYVLCGNTTGIDRRFAQLPTSPIQDPVAGCVLRFSPDLTASEIVADGFRNAYRMDFNLDGELFTYDSDNERCVSLPWYEYTRSYHVLPGGHHGWQAPQRAQTWRYPPYYPDVVPPIATLGRGSPTGLVCYRQQQFPARYQGGLFLLDWTFGKVHFLPLQRAGASYTTTPEVFLEPTGDNGFAPTDAVVHPGTGDLYLAIGGRGTRGGVYRVRYRGGPEKAMPLAPAPRSLAWQPEQRSDLLRQASSGPAPERLRSLLAVQRHRSHFTPEEMAGVVRANWEYEDRLIRKTAADLVRSLAEPARRTLAADARTPWQQVTLGLGTHDGDAAGVLDRACRVLAAGAAPVEARLAAVRLVQLALGGLMAARADGTVWEGYSLRRTDLDAGPRTAAAGALRSAFPAGHADLDREISRTLAALEDDDPTFLAQVGARLTPASHPVEDLHYLIVLARLRAPRPADLTQRVAGALLALDQKIVARRLNRDRNWPLRVAEMHAELARRDPALNAALLASPEFGRPDHALWTRCPGFERRRAAEVFLQRASSDAGFAWNAELVALLDTLPTEQAMPVLRQLWERGGLEEALLPLLARHPDPADRAKYLSGLASPQLATVRLCLGALEKLPPAHSPADLLALVRALRSLPDDKEALPLRERLAGYLGRLTGQEKLGTDRQAWAAWLGRTYPELAARLGGEDGVDRAAWQQRLAGIDWPSGTTERGRVVFQKASCASCHSGAQALGPDLQGVTGRFSRDDLFTAILQPSRDISQRYRTTLVATADDRIYQGMVIYEAVDSLLLQTGPAETVRLVNQQITTRRLTDRSLMPVGLLDKLSDQEIADLYAYLRSLNPATPR